MRKSRITIDNEQANAVLDALSYYLTASRNNFGAGYSGEDPDDAAQLRHERELIAEFTERVERLTKTDG